MRPRIPILAIYQRGASPLESLSFGNNGKADVMLKSLNGERPVAGISLSRFDPAEKLQRAKRVGARPPAGAWRVLPHLSGPTHSGRRSGAQLSGAGTIFQRQEERLAPANFHAGAIATPTKSNWSGRARVKAHWKSLSD